MREYTVVFDNKEKLLIKADDVDFEVDAHKTPVLYNFLLNDVTVAFIPCASVASIYSKEV